MQILVSTKYRVVIPKAVRKRLEIEPGQKMDFEILNSRILISKAKDQPYIQMLKYFILQIRDFLKRLVN